MGDNITVNNHGNLDVVPRDSRDIIPLQTIIEYRRKGLSYADIATLVGCSKQNVHERLQTVAYNPLDNDNFIRNRAEVFAFIQSRLLNTLDESTIQDMTPYQRVIAMGILFDKERLERGESSSNVSVSLNHRLQKALNRRKARVIDIDSQPPQPPEVQPVVSPDTQIK